MLVLHPPPRRREPSSAYIGVYFSPTEHHTAVRENHSMTSDPSNFDWNWIGPWIFKIVKTCFAGLFTESVRTPILSLILPARISSRSLPFPIYSVLAKRAAQPTSPTSNRTYSCPFIAVGITSCARHFRRNSASRI